MVMLEMPKKKTPECVQAFTKGFLHSKEWFIQVMLEKNITSKNVDEKSLNDFVERLLIQIIITWMIQQWKMLDYDPEYLLRKFKQYHLLGFPSYYAFLLHLFTKMKESKKHVQFCSFPKLGCILQVGNASSILDDKDFHLNVDVPDEVFFDSKMLMTIQHNQQHSFWKKPQPILNFLKNWNQFNGMINGYLLGSLLERLLSHARRQQVGAYYTPRTVAFQMCKTAIMQLIQDKITTCNENNYLTSSSKNLGKMSSFIDDIQDPILLQRLLSTLMNLKILDPAMGSGHFLEAAVQVLLALYQQLWSSLKKLPREEQEKMGQLLKRHLITKNDFFQHIQASFPFFSDMNDVHHRLLALDEKHEFFKFMISYLLIFPFTIYGVDIDKQAVQVTKIRLTLLLIKFFASTIHEKPHLGFSIPREFFNFYHGNALFGFLDKISEPPERENNVQDLRKTQEELLVKRLNELLAKQHDVSVELISRLHPIHWILFSSTNLSSSTTTSTHDKNINDTIFDLIIGNPPYVNSKTLSKDVKIMAKKVFQMARGQYDLFILFIERAIQLVKKRGYVSFILPDPILGRSTFSRVRKYLIDNTSILYIHQIKNVFSDPTVSNVILTIKKEQPSPTHQVTFFTHDSPEQFTHGIGKEEHVSQQLFQSTRKHAFLLLSPKHLTLLEKMNSNGTKLGKYIRIFRGEEIGRQSSLLQRQRCCPFCQPMLRGGDIHPFHIHFSDFYIHESNIRKKGYFQPKIVIRQLGERIHAALDIEGKFATLQTVYNVFITTQRGCYPRYLLALLNSFAMNYYYDLLFKDKKLFPRILIENIKDLPMIFPPKERQEHVRQLTLQLETQPPCPRFALTHSELQQGLLLRAQIEALVFHIYRFTKTEIIFILKHLNVEKSLFDLVLKYFTKLSSKITY